MITQPVLIVPAGLYRQRLRTRLQVYKARWQGLLVAVKILNAEESAQQEEFKKEVAMLEALRHPHIVNYLGHLFQESGEVRAMPAPEHVFKDAQGLNIETS